VHSRHGDETLGYLAYGPSTKARVPFALTPASRQGEAAARDWTVNSRVARSVQHLPGSSSSRSARRRAASKLTRPPSSRRGGLPFARSMAAPQRKQTYSWPIPTC